ncbi:MAG: excinuclease ABC subunit UvrC [Bacteroidales bacterium]|nr:excinuclease ABC subunit UvrC [Bacteroidales bacterium]
MSATDEKISLILRSLPDKPGCYRFFDKDGVVIYVGKAKNLKRRVSSYFNKNHDSVKLKMLVSKIRDIHTVIVDSEWEALLLENSLIKQYKPKYNILLKDDKTYPWIAISKEPFPRIYSTRKPDKNKEELYGPYASVKYMNALLETISDIFKLRTCRNMPQNDRACIKYQMKRCCAPCENKISYTEYNDNLSLIRDIIKGNAGIVTKKMHNEMMACAEKWEFEKAQEIKEKIAILEAFQGKSVVVNPEITQVDVFSIITDDESCYVNFLRVMEGTIVQAFTIEIANNVDKNLEELLWIGILEMEEKFGKLNPQVIVPFALELEHPGVTFLVPQRGDKKKLLTLSEKNAKIFMLEKHKRQELVNPERRQQRVLTELQKVLGMDTLPMHIECFDNSNTQGDSPVAAMVCFKNGKPSKSDYRHFLIKTVEGPDDFASMEEVVYRRYKRLLDEEKALPDLIIIDGGKGQLHSAFNSLQALHLENKIMLIGIAERLEDIYKLGDSLPLYIDKKSEAQKLLQRIRDEVHNFGIRHHRNRRSKKSLESRLDTIPGIGKTLSTKLLRQFKSVKRIGEAEESEIAQIIGPAKAKIVKAALNDSTEQSSKE